MLSEERAITVLEKVASLRVALGIGRKRAIRNARIGHAIDTLLGGGGLLGATIGAGKGRRLQAFKRTLVGGGVGAIAGGALGHNLARATNASAIDHLLGTAGLAHLGNLAGGQIALRGLK